MIVLDASAAVEFLLGTEAGRLVAERIGRPGETSHAPHLLDVEVVQAIRRLARSKVVSQARAREAILDLGDLAVRRFPHLPLCRRMWELRGNMTAYDAAYVALAEGLAAPLVTLDERLARTPGHRARIEVPGSG